MSDHREPETYMIRRFHRDPDHPYHGKVIRRGLTFEEAQEHCNDEATHRRDANNEVVWFDGYDKE